MKTIDSKLRERMLRDAQIILDAPGPETKAKAMARKLIADARGASIRSDVSIGERAGLNESEARVATVADRVGVDLTSTTFDTRDDRNVTPWGFRDARGNYGGVSIARLDTASKPRLFDAAAQARSIETVRDGRPVRAQIAEIRRSLERNNSSGDPQYASKVLCRTFGLTPAALARLEAEDDAGDEDDDEDADEDASYDDSLDDVIDSERQLRDDQRHRGLDTEDDEAIEERIVRHVADGADEDDARRIARLDDQELDEQQRSNRLADEDDDDDDDEEPDDDDDDAKRAAAALTKKAKKAKRAKKAAKTKKRKAPSSRPKKKKASAPLHCPPGYIVDARTGLRVHVRTGSIMLVDRVAIARRVKSA